jgi:hypothetical protein
MLQAGRSIRIVVMLAVLMNTNRGVVLRATPFMQKLLTRQSPDHNQSQR